MRAASERMPMSDKTNHSYKVCHLFLSPFRNESRLFKELATAEKLFPADELLSIGIDKEGGEQTGKLLERYPFERIALRTDRLPKTLPFQLLKYLEWTFRAARRASASGAGILHCHSLPALPAAVLAKLFGPAKSLIYDAHELETKRANMSSAKHRASALLERSLIRFADEIIVVSPSIKRHYESQYPGRPVHLLMNMPNRRQIVRDGNIRSAMGIPEDAPLVIYVGALGGMRGIEILLDAMSSVPDWHCLFLGEGPLETAIAKAASANPRIHHHPPVPDSQIGSIVAAADLSYSVIDCSAESYRFALPNKFFQSLSAGVPVLVNRENVDMILVGADTGMVFPIEYQSDAVRALLERYETEPKLGEQHAFSWEDQESKLIDAYVARGEFCPQ